VRAAQNKEEEQRLYTAADLSPWWAGGKAGHRFATADDRGSREDLTTVKRGSTDACRRIEGDGIKIGCRALVHGGQRGERPHTAVDLQHNKRISG